MLVHGKPQVGAARHCNCLNVLTVLTGVENVWGSTADIIPVKVSGGFPTTLNLCFFNDKEAIAFVLNADEGSFFKVSDFTFAGRQVIAIEQPYVTAENVYSMLLSLLG